MKTTVLLSLMLSLTLSSLSSEARKKSQPTITEYEGIVESCYDGDTCRVRIDQKTQKVRFSGIDAPELKQEFGKEARDYLKNLIHLKKVKLKCQGQSWDRKTCLVFLGLQNINEEMVKKGYAWDSPQYSQKAYHDLMNEAQKQKLGLWGKNPISPYCYRKPTSKTCKKDRMAMSAKDL